LRAHEQHIEDRRGSEHRERPAIVDGSMTLPEAPGLGLELRDETLERYGVKLG
jgi:L-alanine-DL-glutamate epimerase-like enolase superfamily enzyme